MLVSEALKNELKLLLDASFAHADKGSMLKFTEKTVNKLSQHIISRHYANLSFELAHLCWVICNLNPRMADKQHQARSSVSQVANPVFSYFYENELVTAKRMQAFFDQTESLSIALAHASVEYIYIKSDDVAPSIAIKIHQHAFSISTSRANILAAFVEWLVGFIPQFFERTHDALSGQGFNGISGLASQWQKQIYAYLSEHLLPVKAQAKHDYMDSFLKRQGVSQFDDDAILTLWRTVGSSSESESRPQGMTRFTSVVKDVFQFEIAIDKAQHMNALSFSSEYEQEWMSEQIQVDLEEDLRQSSLTFSALSEVVDERIPVDLLLSDPKLLSKQQAQRWQLLADYPRQTAKRGLTFIRYECLGAIQAKFSQALRAKRDPMPIFALGEHESYGGFAKKCVAQHGVNIESLRAIVHILLRSAPEMAFELIYEDEKLMSGLMQSFEQKSRAVSETGSLSCDFRKLTHGLAHEMTLQAYKQNNRQGFTASSELNDPTVYQNKAQILLSLDKAIQDLISNQPALFTQGEALDAKYHSDGLIFINELKTRIPS
ncbi:hypothetical protein PN836_001745 [Ningiella sp. W23]|uniref:hypothetical protein n=1 Tax=Ningiella sp. W23 TaxID=3023715 RepID=UPI003757CC40